jgi:threonine dehydrogenase-like Zn-dependent dehydrogenase
LGKYESSGSQRHRIKEATDMKTWRIYGAGDMRLDDVQMPEIKPGWVLVKIRMTQVAVTEVEYFHGFAGLVEKLLEEKSPRELFGHAICGDAVEVGEGVSHIKVGDRVIHHGRVTCNDCPLCFAGYEELFRKIPMMGIQIPGGLAEYVLLPAGSLISVPDTITDSEATATQPAISTMGAVHLTGVEMGDTVVVLGQGSMGLNATQICRVCGAGKVIGVDVRDDTLAISSQLGTDITINARETDPVESVLEITKGVGADIVFDCAGGSPKQGLSSTKTLEQAMRMVREQGKISQIAVLEPNARLDLSSIIMRGVQYRGLGAGSWKLAQYTVDLVASKRVQLAPLVTHILEGLDKVPEAFEITGNKGKYRGINPAQVIVSQ